MPWGMDYHLFGSESSTDRPERYWKFLPLVFAAAKNFLIRDDPDKDKGSAAARGYLATKSSFVCFFMALRGWTV